MDSLQYFNSIMKNPCFELKENPWSRKKISKTGSFIENLDFIATGKQKQKKLPNCL